MPLGEYRLADIPFGISDPNQLRQMFNDRIAALNEILQRLEGDVADIRGEDDREPVIRNTLDMNGHRITGGKRSRRPEDFVIRRELEEAGIFNASPGRALSISRKLNASGGISTSPGSGPGDAVTLEQVESLIDSGIGASVATIKDGNEIDLEDLDGTDGATAGTLLFGYGPGGKARVLRVNANGELVSRNPDMEELLVQLTQAVGALTAMLEGK